MSNLSINFFELKNQLADLGFNAPALVNALREKLISDEQAIFTINCQEFEQDKELRTWFEYDHYPGGDYRLRHFECLFSSGGQDIHRLFAPDITRDEAMRVLRKDLTNNHDIWAEQRPLNRPQLQAYLSIKQHSMNTENLNYLQKQLLNLGFGDKLNDELEKKIKSKDKEFMLTTNQAYNKQNVGYTLHYKAGDQSDMYFFNKYEATHKDTKQTFYLNKGSGITAKEAFNLMEGRAVHKQLENLQLEKYNAWIILDKTEHTRNGDFKLKTFTDGWNYKPERAIDRMDIVGIGEPGAREKLLRSLEKGNRHQVTAMKDGKEVRLFLEANPAGHRVNLTNYKGEAQQLEHYKKPEIRQAHKQEDAPEKKPRKSAKMKV